MHYQFSMGSVSASGEGSYGEGSGKIWLDEVACDGTESSIEQCTHNGWQLHDCQHNEDAAVNCNTTAPGETFT